MPRLLAAEVKPFGVLTSKGFMLFCAICAKESLHVMYWLVVFPVSCMREHTLRMTGIKRDAFGMVYCVLISE